MRIARITQTVVAGMVLILAGGTERASAVPLSDLFGGGSITANDKQFFDWVLLGTSLPSASLASIDVTALTDQPSNPGLRFTVLQDVLTSTGGTFVDLNFQFTVQAPGPIIKDNSLELPGFAVGGFGGVSIFEDVFDDAGDLLASKFVFADDLDQQLLDFAEFDPQATITVQNFITVSTVGAPGDLAAIQVFDQRFSQQVPEPGTLALLAAGLVGLAYGTFGSVENWRKRTKA